MKVRRGAALGVFVLGIMPMQSFAPASEALGVPLHKPKHVCPPGRGHLEPLLVPKLPCKVRGTFQPGLGRGHSKRAGPVPRGPIPSESTESALQPGAAGSSAGTEGGSADTDPAAVAGGDSSRSQKPTKKASPGERLHAKQAEERSPLSRIPWGPVVLAVAFLFTVRRLARLS